MNEMEFLKGHLPQPAGAADTTSAAGTTAATSTPVPTPAPAPAQPTAASSATSAAGTTSATSAPAPAQAPAPTPAQAPAPVAPETVGERIRSQILATCPGTLPLPSDFKAVDDDKLQRVKPITGRVCGPNEAEGAVQHYLRSIGISLRTATDLGLCWMVQSFERDSQRRGADGQPLTDRIQLPCLVYPFRVNGRITNAKARSCAALPPKKEGDAPRFTKDWTQLTNHSAVGIAPFHIECLEPVRLQGRRVPYVVITEGEKDCLALYEAGIPYCISVPCGAASLPEDFLKPFIGWFDAVDAVVLCGDQDLPGRTLTDRLRDFFGPLARVAELPADCKDIADVLLRHGREAVQRIVAEARTPKLHQIVTVSQLHDHILRYLGGDFDHGFNLGFGPYTDRVFHPTHEGGLIVVTGQPNSGKSSFLKDLMLHFMQHGDSRCLFFSFEDPDKTKHYGQMVKLYLRSTDPLGLPPETVERGLCFLDEHMAHVDLKGELATADSIYDLANQYYRERPFGVLVIDPYVYVDFSDRPEKEKETQNVKYLLTRLQSWGHRNRVWVIIVAHPRKSVTSHGGHTSDDVSPDDIADSAHWKNLADFLFAIRRVKQPGQRYTELNMLKVRDQDLCTTGKVYYVRENCGSFLEMASPEACEQWYQLHE